MRRNIRKLLSGLLLAYVLYLFCGGVLPFLGSRPLSDAYIESVDHTTFYSDTLSPDRINVVDDPASGLDIRLRILSEAEETLDIAYYSVHTGTSTDQFLSMVLDAADRGVQVRLLLDGGAGNLRTHKKLAAAIGSHPNIALRFYNIPSLLRPWTINGRMHDKYIIADDRLLLLGGRNIGDRFFAPPEYKGSITIDRDVVVYNTAAGTSSRESVLFQVQDYMDTIWSSPDTKLSFDTARRGSDEEAQRLRQLSASLRLSRNPLFTAPLDWEELTLPTNRITLISNEIRTGRKSHQVEYAIGELMTHADTGILLQSPYLVLSRDLRNLLGEVSDAGIPCALLTNSMASSPNFPAYSLYRRDRKELLDMGLRIYEFQDCNSIHAKTLLIDHRMSLVGSYNLDPRSEALDTELMLAIDSTAFSDRMSSVMEHYLDHSLVLSPDGGYLSGSVAPIENNPIKTAAMVILGLLLTPFRSLV